MSREPRDGDKRFRRGHLLMRAAQLRVNGGASAQQGKKASATRAEFPLISNASPVGTARGGPQGCPGVTAAPGGKEGAGFPCGGRRPPRGEGSAGGMGSRHFRPAPTSSNSCSPRVPPPVERLPTRHGELQVLAAGHDGARRRERARPPGRARKVSVRVPPTSGGQLYTAPGGWTGRVLRYAAISRTVAASVIVAVAVTFCTGCPVCDTLPVRIRARLVAVAGIVSPPGRTGIQSTGGVHPDRGLPAARGGGRPRLETASPRSSNRPGTAAMLKTSFQTPVAVVPPPKSR